MVWYVVSGLIGGECVSCACNDTLPSTSTNSSSATLVMHCAPPLPSIAENAMNFPIKININRKRHICLLSQSIPPPLSPSLSSLIISSPPKIAILSRRTLPLPPPRTRPRLRTPPQSPIPNLHRRKPNHPRIQTQRHPNLILYLRARIVAYGEVMTLCICSLVFTRSLWEMRGSPVLDRADYTWCCVFRGGCGSGAGED